MTAESGRKPVGRPRRPPGSASAPVPLILVGHPGGLCRMHPRLAERARHSVAAGFAAATIELPGIRGPVGYSGGVTAIGLRKTLHANMGGHTGVPWFEGDAGNRFFARHLG